LTRQVFGTLGNDDAWDVAAPKGGVGAVVVGTTTGALDGVNKGDSDAFIRKYDSSGVVWARQFGTTLADSATDVAVTDTGISYVLGETDAALAFKVGKRDVFLRKYDANGVGQWTKQFGTIEDDLPRDVTLDNSGNVYVLSRDSDAWFRIRKFSPSGTSLLTITNASSPVSNPAAIQVDSTGNIFVLARVGYSYSIARLFKYSSAGTLLASPDVFPGAIPTDLIVDSSNNLYLSVDNYAGFIRKVNNEGKFLWQIRIEPASIGAKTIPTTLAIGIKGNIYVTGNRIGAFPGFTSGGRQDIFVLQLSPTTGARLWAQQFGGNGPDYGLGIAASDRVYVAGYTFSDPNLVGDTPYGGTDAFLAQLDRVTGAILEIDQ
jgi:hypothetical protein